MQRTIEAGHPQTTHFGSLQASAQATASLFAGVLVGQDFQEWTREPQNIELFGNEVQ